MITGYAVYTSIGTVRKENQDNFYLNGLTKPVSDSYMEEEGDSSDAVQLFAVCDGMGGEESGEVAASLAVETLKFCDKETDLNRCMALIKEANRKICEYQKEHDVMIGTTFAGILVNHEDAYAINAGDSRIYRIRDGEIVQLSRDHTEYQVMLDAKIPMNERTKRSAKNRLTQFLGIPEEEMESKPRISQISPLRKGDRYLICSDGLYGVTADNMLLTIAGDANYRLEKICKTLVDTAEKLGSRDNVTAMMIQIGETSQTVLEEKQTTVELSERTQEITTMEYPQETSVCMEMESLIGSENIILKGITENDNREDTMENIDAEKMQQEPDVKLKKTKIRVSSIIKGIAIASLLLIIGYGYWIWSYPIVPNVVNMDRQMCRETLEKSGFKIEEIEEYNAEVSEGCVIRQSISSNTRIKRGREILVTVSQGAEPEVISDMIPETETYDVPLEVPNVVKKHLKEGKEILENQGFQVDIIWIYRGDGKKDRGDLISNQFPEAGNVMKQGETVNIEVRTSDKEKAGKGE